MQDYLNIITVSRFGRVPKVQNSSGTDTPDRAKESAADIRGQEKGLRKEEQKQEEEEVMVVAKREEEVVVDVERRGEEVGERKPVESLAGEREHRVPNITRLVG